MSEPPERYVWERLTMPAFEDGAEEMTGAVAQRDSWHAYACKRKVVGSEEVPAAPRSLG